LKPGIRQHSNAVVTALLIGFFFAVVFRGPSRPGEIRGWFEVFFEIALSMGLAAAIWRHNKWMSAFLLLVTVSMFYPHYGPMSYLGGRAVFNGCLWFWLIITFVKFEHLPMVFRLMRIFVYFHVGVALFQHFKIAGILSTPVPTGLMANPLELAALIGFCFPAFLVLKGKRLLLLIVPALGLFFAKQFIGIAATGIGVLFYLAVKHKMYWPIIPVAAIAVIWMRLVDPPGIEHRLYVWKKAVMAWKQHWIMGAGIGHWKAVFANPMATDGKRWVTTHNEFLQMLFELGIGSAIIFAGYFRNIIKRCRAVDVIPLTALVIIVIHSGASFPFHIAPLAMIALTWIAILELSLGR
jgi:hypothetical protein